MHPSRRGAVLVCAVLAALGLGLACDEAAPIRSFECAVPAKVTHLRDIHYEGASCEVAIASAESHLAAAYFRKACEQLAPDRGVPERVADAYVSSCAASAEEGAVLQIDVCCR